MNYRIQFGKLNFKHYLDILCVWGVCKFTKYFCSPRKRLPFDWRNPFGFLVANTIQCVMLSYALLIGACALVLAIGGFLYIIELSKCIKHRLFALGPRTDAKTNLTCILNQLAEFIELHSNVKQLTESIFFRL